MALPDFKILIDTREQRPFDFSKYGVLAERATLQAGDYCLAGQPEISVERKSPGDLLSCMGRDRDRFQRELERLQQLDFAAVVCEAPMPVLLSGQYSRIKPASVVGTVVAWQQRFPAVHWWFLESRAWAEKLTLKILKRFHTDATSETRKAKATA